MSVNIKATLYHAKWCGHCKNFLPEWSSFASDVDKKKIKHKGAAFSHEAFEESELRNDKTKDDATINGEPVRGFPTIKISVSSNGKTKEFEYDGKRRSSELASYMKVLASRESNN